MRHVLFVAAGLACLAACSDTGTGADASITAEMRADVAAATGAALATDVEGMSRSSATGSGSLFAFAGAPATAGCTFNLGTFVCLNTLGSLDGTANLTFKDGSGTAQDSYDASATASVDIATDVSGSVSHGNFEITYSRTASFTVSGLAGDETERTWNGTATTTVSSSLFNGNHGYTMDASTDFNGVIVPTGGSEPRWPTSGTATTQVDFEVTGGPHAGTTGTLTATITFNGTGQVPLRIGTTEFTLNLDSHAVAEVQ